VGTEHVQECTEGTLFRVQQDRFTNDFVELFQVGIEVSLSRETLTELLNTL
jgi:hypothetical protein